MKISYKIAAAATAAVFAATGVTVYAEKENRIVSEPETKAPEKRETAETAEKDETVYVFAGSDGSVKKILVSDWLKNTSAAAALNDVSYLSEIENIKGSEEFSAKGNSLVWSADGNDIYYSGKSSEALPIEMKVVYTLDGREIPPVELAGKSGRLVIRCEFVNHRSESVEIDGKTERVSVPFAALTAIVLDSDTCRNVEVTSGKILNDGDRTVIAGIAFPGLGESLGIDREKLDIPDSFEVSADVVGFEMTNTLTLVTNEIFSGNGKEINFPDDLNASFGELNEGMTALTEGSSRLYDGLCALLNQSGELVSGTEALYNGAEELNEGAVRLGEGAAEFNTGAERLNAGLERLSENSAALNGGAQKVFETLLSAAESRLAAAGLEFPKLTVENYSEVLTNAAAGSDKSAVYDAALKKVTDAVYRQRDTVKQAVAAAVEAEVREKVLASAELTPEAYEAGVAAETISPERQAQIEDAVRARMNSDETKAVVEAETDERIAALTEQQMNSEEVKEQIAEGEKRAEEGAKQLMELKAQLDSYNEFYTGLLTYTSGVDSAHAGAEQLSAGAEALKNGAAALHGGTAELRDGLGALNESAPALIDGITRLRDGSGELSDGIREFNEKGVQRLTDAADGDLARLIERWNATVKASEKYRTYSGISDEMNGSVKFIYRTEAIRPR